jgi:hypothetical protein
VRPYAKGHETGVRRATSRVPIYRARAHPADGGKPTSLRHTRPYGHEDRMRTNPPLERGIPVPQAGCPCGTTFVSDVSVIKKPTRRGWVDAGGHVTSSINRTPTMNRGATCIADRPPGGAKRLCPTAWGAVSNGCQQCRNRCASAAGTYAPADAGLKRAPQAIPR